MKLIPLSGLAAATLSVLASMPVSGAEILHYVLAPGSTITPCLGPAQTGPTEPLTGRFDWVQYPGPAGEIVYGFNANALEFQSASFTIRLNRTPANDLMSAVHSDSTLTVFGEVVDVTGLSLPNGYFTSISPGSYSGPATRPNVLNYPAVELSPLGGGSFFGRADLVAVLEELINIAPSFTKGSDVTVLQNCGSQTLGNWATSISAGPPWESAQLLQFFATSDRPELFAGPPFISIDGKLSFTPALNRSGTATVMLVLKDNGGTLYGGHDTSAPQRFVITILGPSETLQLLIEHFEQTQLGQFNKKPLLNRLAVAARAFEREQWDQGISQLQVFQRMVRTQLTASYPAIAQQLAEEAQAIINIFNPSSTPTAQLQASRMPAQD